MKSTLLNDTLNILATAIFMQLFKLLISQTWSSNNHIPVCEFCSCILESCNYSCTWSIQPF